MNLPGIWNNNLACNTGWTCDFHLDINTQQNYSPAEVADLPECHEPLFRPIESLRVAGLPSDRISPRSTPELASAARVPLERRLGRHDWEDVEWSRGNLIAFFARLRDGAQLCIRRLGVKGIRRPRRCREQA